MTITIKYNLDVIDKIVWTLLYGLIGVLIIVSIYTIIVPNKDNPDNYVLGIISLFFSLLFLISFLNLNYEFIKFQDKSDGEEKIA